MENPRVTRIEWARLEGRKPRAAGGNARLIGHSQTVRPPLARVTLEGSVSGFGWSSASREQAVELLGKRWDEVFSPDAGAHGPGAPFDYPLWDLAGQRAGAPVYALVGRGAVADVATPFRARCYDTTLLIDDLHLASNEEAAALIAAEARDGYERGHRAFKIKIGRGARHLPLEEGMRRDVAVVQAVREAAGPDAPIMLDVNNGFNLNLAKRILEETADCHIFWLEEPFHEDTVLYQELKEWLASRGLGVLIADGEGQASPSLLQWTRDKLIDVVQYDIYGYGFSRWLALGKQLDEWGARSAPHHYGGHYGNYVSGHLAAAVRGFTYVEWDEAATPGLDTSAYAIEEGWVRLPETPGFGLALEESAFQSAVRENGWTVA